MGVHVYMESNSNVVERSFDRVTEEKIAIG